MRRINLISFTILAGAIAAVACTENSKELDVEEEGDIEDNDGDADGDARDDADAEATDGDASEDSEDLEGGDAGDVVDVGDIVDAGEDERESPYQCWEGECCNTSTGLFLPAGYSCGLGGMEYGCSSSECGADAREREFQQRCTGTSAECDDEAWYGEWVTPPGQDCDSDEICVTDTESYSICQICPNGCADGACIEP